MNATALAYDFARHEHYSHLRLCEHGLSSAHQDAQRLPEQKRMPFITKRHHTIRKGFMQCPLHIFMNGLPCQMICFLVFFSRDPFDKTVIKGCAQNQDTFKERFVYRLFHIVLLNSINQQH